MKSHLSFPVSLLTLMVSVSAAAADDVPLASRDDITATAQLSEAPHATLPRSGFVQGSPAAGYGSRVCARFNASRALQQLEGGMAHPND
jgi:hypothetical protein